MQDHASHWIKLNQNKKTRAKFNQKKFRAYILHGVIIQPKMGVKLKKICQETIEVDL